MKNILDKPRESLEQEPTPSTNEQQVTIEANILQL